MKLAILAIGKLGVAPEAQLARDYARRAGAAGRSLGLGPVDIIEVEARRPGKTFEGEALLERLDDALLIACDERGDATTSRAFALFLARLRDRGERAIALAVGGADGLDDRVHARAAHTLAFGPQTWPHALARVMLAEQIYRAVTILAGSPYHRD